MTQPGDARTSVTAMLLSVMVLTSGLVREATGELLPQCSEVTALASHTPAPSEAPQSLAGTWVSERCETRPGPHFVLRSYAFYPDQEQRLPSTSTNDAAGETGRFELKLHLYSDPECQDPLRSYSAQGHFGAQRVSWALPGAAEQQYWVKRISVVAHNDQEAEHVAQSVAAACPGRTKDWAAFRSEEIIWLQYDPKTRRTTNRLPQPHHSVAYFHDESSNTTRTVNLRNPATQAPSDNLNYMEGTTTHRNTAQLDCRGELAINWGELELFRLLASPKHIKRSDRGAQASSHTPDLGLRKELLLGHPAPVAGQPPHTSQEGYHPTTFQTPLVLATEENLRRCEGCRAVFAGDTGRPPRLPPSTAPATRSPEGVWASSTCDAAPHGLFLVRQLHFRKKTWTADQVHFTDHECTKPAYAFHASGDYAIRATSTGRHEAASVGPTVDLKNEEKRSEIIKLRIRKSKPESFKKSASSSTVKSEKNQATAKNTTLDILVIFLALRNLTITPLASHVAEQLNNQNGGCGEIGKWQVGVSQDTTINKGCKSIGISVPSLHQCPFKFGHDSLNGTELLFIGDAYAPLSDTHPNMSLVFPDHEDWRASPPDYDFELEVGHPKWGWGSPLTRCTDTLSGNESTVDLEQGDRWKYVNYDRHAKVTEKSSAPSEGNTNAIHLRTTELERNNTATAHHALFYVVCGSIFLVFFVQ